MVCLVNDIIQALQQLEIFEFSQKYISNANYLYILICKIPEAYIIILKWKEEEFEDSKGEIRIHISKKNRQHNGQKKKYKRTNNYLQNLHIELKSSNTNPTQNRG